MKIADYKGYEVHVPTSGGKAGKGCNVTSTIQVRRDSTIKKQFRFILANEGSRKDALAQARRFMDTTPATP